MTLPTGQIIKLLAFIYYKFKIFFDLVLVASFFMMYVKIFYRVPFRLSEKKGGGVMLTWNSRSSFESIS